MRRLIAIAVLAACAAMPAAASAARPVLGIADQKPDTFTDPRFASLGLANGRMNLPWDVLSDPATLTVADAWMAAAKDANVQPLLTIDRSRRPGRAAVNPTPAQLAGQVARWRARWPGQVTQLSTWNEGNLNKRPELVAKWWLAVRKACPGCTVLGADLVDASNAVSWAKRFVKAAHRAPATWGLHSYNDANTFTTRSTTAFLRGVKGNVWLTETGGVVSRSCPRFHFSGTGVSFAAKATDFLLRRIAPLSPRIKRIYIYSWSSGTGPLTWDSGLIGPAGDERPALGVVRDWLGLGPDPAPEPPDASLADPAMLRAVPGATVCKKPLAAKKAKGKAAPKGKGKAKGKKQR